MALDETNIDPPVRDRYTLDGDAAVEARINHDQALVADAVRAVIEPPRFRALVLMGGYGRGEGGYITRAGYPAPYNDYDYFVVVQGVERAEREALNRALSEQAKALEENVGVEVDFALLHEERLPGAEYSLMNAEMIWGHRVILGDEHILDAMPPMPFATLPLGEFTRLMLNRGALLLMNQMRLNEGEADAAGREILFKYLFKAVLACGDTRLAGVHAYHPSYPRKRERLQDVDWPNKVSFMSLYNQAFEHKFHPDYGRFSGEDACNWQRQVVSHWLETMNWFEGVRTGTEVGDWTNYCSPRIPKGQGGRSWGGLRNAAITLRDFGAAEVMGHPFWSLRYPRERLISVLPWLLANPGVPPIRPVTTALGMAAGGSGSSVADNFLRLWRRYA
jgi:hypothetical protein